MATPNDDDLTYERNKDNNEYKSNEKINKPPIDKKVLSSINANNNEMLYSKDLIRDSNHKRKKLNIEKNKL
jgi:hypothetical protein